MEFSLKKWGVAVHTRKGRQWVSYDPKGDKVECPLSEVLTYFCDIHTQKMGTHRIVVWHLHTKKWDSSTQKKRQSTRQAQCIKGKEIKRNNEIWSFRKNERPLRDSCAKLSGIVPLENWRICTSVHTWKNSVSFTQKKENMVQTVYDFCNSHN